MQELLAMLQESYSDVAYPTTLDDLKRADHFHFWAFFQNQKIGTTGFTLKTPTLVETVKTVILPAYRGKKLGKQVSQAIEDECKRRGIKKVMSTIYASNHTMIAIKLKQGYTIEGFHPDHEAPGYDEYSLGKIL